MSSVVRSLEKRMVELKKVAHEECVDAMVEYLEKDMENSKRRPAPPPPLGGISIRAASRKYGIASSTITGWMQKGFIRVLEKRLNWTYLVESDVAEISDLHKSSPKRGWASITRKLAKK